MPQLPSGTVTLLFSDVQGSTALVRELGEAAGGPRCSASVRCAEQRAWGAHHGHQLGTEGDSFMVVFRDRRCRGRRRRRGPAPDRRGSKLAPQAHPGRQSGSGSAPGLPDARGRGLRQLDVHKAARVAAAAHGGQVLVSEATAALVDGTLAADEALLDLGEHALKDIPHRIRLYQLIAPGLAHKPTRSRRREGLGACRLTHAHRWPRQRTRGAARAARRQTGTAGRPSRTRRPGKPGSATAWPPSWPTSTERRALRPARLGHHR